MAAMWKDVQEYELNTSEYVQAGDTLGGNQAGSTTTFYRSIEPRATRRT